MNAVKLRNILLGLIALVIILVGVAIYYAHGFLQAETTKTAHTRIEAELSARDVERLKSLEKIIGANQSSVQKAEQIVAETKQYQYQDQIVSDINSYASKTGVQVTAFDFGSTSAPAPAGAAKAVSGVKSITVTLTLKSPLAFDSYLRFLKAIEQNLTKMQVSGVNLSPDVNDVNSVANPTIGLTVYVR